MSVQVDCPTCAARVLWTSTSHWRPFCSERCKLIDLGAWASDRHVIPGRSVDQDEQPSPLDPSADGNH